MTSNDGEQGNPKTDSTPVPGPSPTSTTSGSGRHAAPPPLPHPKEAESHPAPAPAKRSSGFIVLSVVVLLIAGAAGMFFKLKATGPEKVAAPAPAPSASAQVQPASVVEVPAEVASSQDATVCVQAYFPEGSFGQDADFKFMCEETDAWRIAEKILAALTAHGQADAVKTWQSLGTFELGIVSAMRAGCCTGAENVKADVPSKACGSATEKLRALGPEPTLAGLDGIDELFQCLKQRKVRLPERWDDVSHDQATKAAGQYFPALRDNVAKGADEPSPGAKDAP